MAVQVSWPGVYVDEFEPGAPIEGVGTNTAVFLGIASTGPVNRPTLISSWDDYVKTFGGFSADLNAWLAKGVYGFFLNGGTRCYIVRASTAKKGTTTLAARGASSSLRRPLKASPAMASRSRWKTPAGPVPRCRRR